LRTRTDCGSKTGVVLQTRIRIFDQDSWTDAVRKFQDPHITVWQFFHYKYIYRVKVCVLTLTLISDSLCAHGEYNYYRCSMNTEHHEHEQLFSRRSTSDE